MSPRSSCTGSRKGTPQTHTRVSSPEGTCATGDSSRQPHPLDPVTATLSLPVPGAEDRTGRSPRENFPSGGEKTSGALCPSILPPSTRLPLAETTVPRGHQDLGFTEPGPPTPLRKGGEGTRTH